MKILLTIAFILSISIPVMAEGLLQRDQNKTIIQGAAPDGGLSQILTVNSTTVDMRQGLWWNLHVPTVATCKYRITPTIAKAAFPQFSIGAGERISFVVNRATAFINYSGCTSGELSRQ